MEVVLLVGGFVLLVVLSSGTGPPRWVWLRGAAQWTDADDAQQKHLDHWGRGTGVEYEEGEE